jgi:hypothetical protein
MNVDDECRIRNHRVARPRPRRAVDLARARSFARFSFCRSRASRRRPRASTRSRDAIVASRNDASAPSRHLGVPTFFRLRWTDGDGGVRSDARVASARAAIDGEG